MLNSGKKNNSFLLDQIFNSTIKQLKDITQGKDIHNRKRRIILHRYPELKKSYQIILDKSIQVMKSRNTSIFNDFPIIGNKTDSTYTETAIPNLISVMDTLIILESSTEFKKASKENRKFIREAVDIGIVNLSRKMIIPHSKIRTASWLCLLSSIVIGAYVLGAIATSGGLLAITMVGISTAGFLAFGTPVYDNLIKLKFQLSSEKTKIFQGYANFKTTSFKDLISQFTTIDNKKIDLTNHKAVLNSVITHTNAPVRLNPYSLNSPKTSDFPNRQSSLINLNKGGKEVSLLSKTYYSKDSSYCVTPNSQKKLNYMQSIL